MKGYEDMKQRQDNFPPQDKVRLTAALERLVRLYGATNQPDRAGPWLKKLAETNTANRDSSK